MLLSSPPTNTNCSPSINVPFFSSPFFFQPVELLPCSLSEIREHLSAEGDLSLQALQLLRAAEEERRGESQREKLCEIEFWAYQETKPVSSSSLFCSLSLNVFSFLPPPTPPGIQTKSLGEGGDGERGEAIKGGEQGLLRPVGDGGREGGDACRG